MFGHAAFGEVPAGALRPPSVAFGAAAELRVDWQFTIYAASRPMTTGAGDTPAHQPFLGTLDKPISFRRSLLGGSTIGVFTTGDGEASINNIDGRYDFLVGPYSVDGRDVTIKLGRDGDRYRDFMPIFVGTAANWLVAEDRVTLTLRDFGYKLNVPLQTRLYAGSGGAEGGDDLAGKRPPRAFGVCLNVTPAFLVPNLLIWQVHDGALEAIDAVYDRGAALTAGDDYADYAALAAATVPAGSFATCLAEGLFKLGSPPAGTVTADLRGDNAGGYVETTADIVRRIVETSTVFTDDADFYLPAFAAVNTAQPAIVGYYAGPDVSVSVADVVANLMGGIGGWGGFRRQGKFEVGIVATPAALPVMRLDNALGDIVSISREALPDGIYPPPYRFRVAYARNWTVQDDLAGSVSADRKAFAAEAVRIAESASETVKTDHPNAQDPDVIQSYFAEEAAAQAEATRLLNLYRSSRGLYRIKTGVRGFRLNLGETVVATYPRWDLTGGRNLLAVEISEDGENNQVEIVGFG